MFITPHSCCSNPNFCWLNPVEPNYSWVNHVKSPSLLINSPILLVNSPCVCRGKAKRWYSPQTPCTCVTSLALKEVSLADGEILQGHLSRFCTYHIYIYIYYMMSEANKKETESIRSHAAVQAKSAAIQEAPARAWERVPWF